MKYNSRKARHNTMQKHRIVFVSLFLVLAALLASCTQSVRNDVYVTDIAAAVESKISMASNLTDMSKDTVEFYLGVDLSSVSEYIVRAPSGSASIDEYGIFKVKGTDEAGAVSLLALVNAYLANRIENWDTRYDQSEKDKVMKAKAEKRGNYVIYVILSDSERDAALSEFESILK